LIPLAIADSGKVARCDGAPMRPGVVMKNGMWKLGLAVALAAALPVMAKAPEQPQVESVSPHRWLGPAKAIHLAKTNSRPVAGVFVITVANTGRIGDKVYLNSKPDYKDPACLTFELQPHMLHELEAKLGGDVQEMLAGKTVAVWGAVKRVPIVNEDAPKKIIYFQTHVFVSDPNEVRIVPADLEASD